MSDVAHLLWQFVRGHSYLAIFLLILVEEGGVPLLFLPGDALIMWSGFQAAIGHVNPLVVILITTAAVGLGSSTLYTASYRLGPRVVSRLGRLLHFAPGKLEQVERELYRHAFLAVVLGRLIPGLRIPTSVTAGALQVPFRVFLPATLSAAVVWTLFYFVAGAIMGSAWRRVGSRVQVYLALHAVLLIPLAMVLLGVALFFALRSTLRTSRTPANL